jgi:hypothetical protein
VLALRRLRQPALPLHVVEGPHHLSVWRGRCGQFQLATSSPVEIPIERQLDSAPPSSVSPPRTSAAAPAGAMLAAAAAIAAATAASSIDSGSAIGSIAPTTSLVWRKRAGGSTGPWARYYPGEGAHTAAGWHGSELSFLLDILRYLRARTYFLESIGKFWDRCVRGHVCRHVRADGDLKPARPLHSIVGR